MPTLQQPTEQPQGRPRTAIAQARDILQLSENPQALAPEEPAPEEPEQDPSPPLAAQAPDSLYPDTTDAEVEAGGEPEEEAPDITDLGQLAAAIEVDPEWLYNLRIPISTGDGKEYITVGQYKDQVQAGEVVTADADRLKYERDILDQDRQKFETERNATLQQAQQVPQQVMQAEARAMGLQQQYQSADWSTLEQQDPGRAALMKQNMASEYQQAVQEADQARGQYQQLQKQAMVDQRRHEEQKLLLSIDTWRDPNARKQGTAEISKMLAEVGYTTDEISNFMDHRAIILMNELATLRKQVGAGDAAAKRVREAPKALAPGARRTATKKQPTVKQLRDSVRNAKPGGRRGAELAAAKVLLGVKS